MTQNKCRVTVNASGSYRLLGNRSNILKRANDFLNYSQSRGLSPHSLRAYAYDLQYLIRWYRPQQSRFKRLPSEKVQEYIKFQQIQRSNSRSVNRRLATCTLFNNFCDPKGQARSFDYTRTRKPQPWKSYHRFRRPLTPDHTFRVRTPKRLIDPLSDEEVETFSRSFLRARDMAMNELLLNSGLRSAEALSLKVEDCDLEREIVKIQGKGNRERCVPISSKAVSLIRKYIENERPIHCKSPCLFVILQGARRGQSMTPAGIRSVYRYRRRMLGLPKANPHRFRHTFAVSMIQGGSSIPALQKMMGHSNPEITMHYIKIDDKEMMAQYKKAMTMTAQKRRRRNGR